MKVAVIGGGVVGLATTLSLLKLGIEVHCYEASSPMMGRSAGSSRIFRLAHRTPALVELAQRALHKYRGWEQRATGPLLTVRGLYLNDVELQSWTAALASADAAFQLYDVVPRTAELPVKQLVGPIIFDPSAGVLDVNQIRAFLVSQASSAIRIDQVRRVCQTGDSVQVYSASGVSCFDGVVVAAGASTSALVREAGIAVPNALSHHFRFSFRLKKTTIAPPCVVDQHQTRPFGVRTYQHFTGSGEWAIGLTLPPEESAWDVGQYTVRQRSRRLVMNYVQESIQGIESPITDEIYCNPSLGWGDGYQIIAKDRVVAIDGDNLFKFAPILGDMLASEVVRRRR